MINAPEAFRFVFGIKPKESTTAYRIQYDQYVEHLQTVANYNKVANEKLH